MSSIVVLTSMLHTAQTNLFHIGGPILISISTIGCILNLLVFTRHHLRKNPCSICFIVLNITHILYTFLSFLPAILQVGYNIDPSASNLIVCRCRYYFGFVLASLERYYLVLASIDRALVTSKAFQIRRWSNSLFISISIGSITLFWIVFHTHALINTNIFPYDLNLFVCASNPGVYSTFITFYSLIFHGIIPPLLMIIFGMITMKNIRRLQRVSAVTLTSEMTGISRRRNLNSKERQMAVMLLSEILIYVTFGCLTPIYLVYEQITVYTLKSIEQLVSIVLLFILFIPYSIDFYINYIVSKNFRKEIKKIFK